MNKAIRLALITSIGLLPVSHLMAKKVICVATNSSVADPTFLNNHEGWERQNMAPGDVIQVGGSLTDCMAQLQNGDELVIITHGSDEGAFEWNGVGYSGFGDGDDEYPVPDGLNTKNIHIKFCACYSGRDPDGPTKPDKPIKDKLKDKCGAGTTADGFTDVSKANSCFKVTSATATQAQVDAVVKKLNKNKSWSSKTPFNRNPEPVPSDRSYAQQIADSLGFNVTVTITYKQPVNATVAPPTGGGSFVTGCTCSGFDCGLSEWTADEHVHTESVALPTAALIPNGIHRLEEDMTLVPNFPGSSPIMIRNLRLFGFAPTSPIPLPGQFGTFNSGFQAAIQISLDQGQTWIEQITGGTMSGLASTIIGTSPDSFLDITVNSLQFQTFPGGDMPYDMITILKNPIIPSSGVMSFKPAGTGFAIDSYFDITFQGMLSNGTSAAACGSSTVILECPGIQNGCTDPNAVQFQPCAIFNNGMCTPPLGGCTYPGAMNYDAGATEDNGTCLFYGCTDPTANNFDPTANFDSGDCAFGAACPTDLNSDGATNTTDLLLFLSAYGTTCE